MSLPRHLLLVFAIAGTVVSMGFYRVQNSEESHEDSGDWPEEFPGAPDGFKFGCNRPCPCRCRRTTPKATVAPTTTTAAPTEVPSTVPLTSTTTVIPSTSTVSQSTPQASTTTVVPSTSTVSRSTPHASTTTVVPSTSTVSRSTPHASTTTVVPSTSTVSQSTPQVSTTTVIPSVTTPAANAPIQGQRESDNSKNKAGNLVLEGGELDGADVGGEATETPDAPKTGTTFWIRTPTPPNLPFPVDPNAGGSLNFGTPKILSPFAPEQALKPLDANLADSDGFDFNIATVGTPMAPRAVVDPDA